MRFAPSTGVLEEGTEGGDGSRDPNDDVDADAAGEDPDIDLVPDGMIGDEKEEEEDPERDGGKREEEAAIKAVEEVEVVEEVEQEANWLDRDASEVLPKTAPGESVPFFSSVFHVLLTTPLITIVMMTIVIVVVRRRCRHCVAERLPFGRNSTRIKISSWCP